MKAQKDLSTTFAQAIAVPEAVEGFFKENAGIGSENLSQSLPQLKITEANSQNEGLDGQFVEPGMFYYQPTKEAFKDVEVSIMTISRGFYALDNSKEPKPKFTQLVGGMMTYSMQPFVMFLSGTRLNNMWEFGKEIKPFVSSKAHPIPMLAFRVKLSLEKLKTQYGTNYVVKFTLVRNDKSQIEIMNDLELLQVLKNGVEQIEDTFESFMYQKECDRETGKLLKDMKKEEEVYQDKRTQDDVHEALIEPDMSQPSQDDVSDEIPF